MFHKMYRFVVICLLSLPLIGSAVAQGFVQWTLLVIVVPGNPPAKPTLTGIHAATVGEYTSLEQCRNAAGAAKAVSSNLWYAAEYLCVPTK